MAAAAIFIFKNFNFWSRDCHRVQYLMYDLSLRYGDLTIFKMAAAAILNFKNFNFCSRDCHWVHYLL